MKLLIVTNFAYPFHTGGSEKIVQQVAESMSNDFGWHVDVFCNYGNCRKNVNSVQIIPFNSSNNSLFIDSIISGNYDKIFIYGDLSTRLLPILENIDRINKPIILAAVGFNRLRSSANDAIVVRNLFHSNVNKLQIIVHSDDYVDSMYCKKHNIPYTVIHNSIQFGEFVNQKQDICNKYSLGNKKLILCVSNFFPGKGQEHIVKLAEILQSKRNDFIIVFVSSTLSYKPGNIKRELLQRKCKSEKLPVFFLNDIPRQDVISLYQQSAFSLCASEQEVGPIVILESMAARKPWISTNVGHVHKLQGGFFFPHVNNDKSQPLAFDDKMQHDFMDKIEYLLDNTNETVLGEAGYEQVKQEYDWDRVKFQYKTILQA